MKRTTKNLNPKLLAAHGKTFSSEGVCYRIIAHSLGSFVLAQAEEVKTGVCHNLVTSRNPLVMNLRERISLGLVG